LPTDRFGAADVVQAGARLEATDVDEVPKAGVDDVDAVEAR